MVSDNKINTDLLIEQLRQGSEWAFTGLYDLYAKQLFRNIHRLVKDEDVAEELLQDLFLKIWERRAVIDPGRSFKSFLYKVAENLVYSYFRRVALDKRMVANLIAASVEYEVNAEDVRVAKETYDLLHKAIAQLSPQRKLIYMLCKFERKSYEEVGRELGISVFTVRNQIVKANKVVREYFLTNQDVAVILVVAELLRYLK